MASRGAVAGLPGTGPEVRFVLSGLRSAGARHRTGFAERLPAVVFTLVHLSALVWLRLAVPDRVMDALLDPGELVTYLDVPPPEEPASPRAVVRSRPLAVSEDVTIPAVRGQVVHPDKAAGFQELLAPKELDRLPPPSHEAEVHERDFTGRGVVGGVAGGRPPPALPGHLAAAMAREGQVSDVAALARRTRPMAPVEMAALDVPPRLLNRREILELLLALYPPALRDLGVEGSVMVQFIVDTTGQVEPGSAFIVSSSHPLFSAAALAVAQRARFSPGRMSLDGRLATVRSAVRAPFSWSQANPGGNP